MHTIHQLIIRRGVTMIKRLVSTISIFLPLSFLIFVSLSCGKSEEDIKEEKYKTSVQTVDSINDIAAHELVTKYHAVSEWDTLKLFTYVYQKIFIEENRLISFEGEIEDVSTIGTTYVLKVQHGENRYNRYFEAEISVSKEMFQRMEKKLSHHDIGNIGWFIFKVQKIVSLSPELTSEYESEGEDSYSYLTYDFNKRLIIFKGDMVDFYFLR